MAVNVGVLGFAHGHIGMYCKEWREKPALGVAIMAGWDHDAARLKQSSDSLAIRPFTDASALLAQADIPAVIITAETSRHAELVEQAAAAGKAIVLQKPIAMTMAEADRIVAAVARYRVPFTMAWQMRVDAQNLKIKELLQSGMMGKVFMVRRRHGLATHLWKGFSDLWHNKPELNRDIWADDAAHPIDFLHWLLGVPETVTAELATICDPRVPNDNGIAVFRYKNGPLAEVVCSFVCAAAENTVEVIAERGTIVLNYGDVPSCNVPRPDGACGLKWYIADTKTWTHSDIPSPATHGSRISGLAAPIAEFLQGKRPPISTADEARTSLRMTLATYVSSREGRRVRIDDRGVETV
jgi:predicted dehydrogenase